LLKEINSRARDRETNQQSFRRESRYSQLTTLLWGQRGGGGKAGTTTWMCARFRVTTRDSPRLFAEYEEVCRYKYNAFLSHRFAPRCHRWLTQWHLKSLIVDVFLRRTRAKGTRISTSWNLLWHYNPFHVNAPESTRFRVERSVDHQCSCLEFLFQTNWTPPPPSPSIEIASAFPPDHAAFRREWHTSSKNWKVQRETEKFNVTSNLIHFPFKRLGNNLKFKVLKLKNVKTRH